MRSRKLPPIAAAAPWLRAMLGAALSAATIACGASPAPEVDLTAQGSATSHTAEAPPPEEVPPPREDGRLPEGAIPREYRIKLRVDPTQPRFSGVATILVDLPRPTSHVVLNAAGLRFMRALARVDAKEIEAKATLRPAFGTNEDREVVLAFDHALPAGSAEIELTYDAPFASDLLGLYRVQEDGRWYVYSQFEPTYARRAFPCFDEPGLKTTYDVRIFAPHGMEALSNGPEQSRAQAPDGMEEHVFEPTPPLPSYLVAFAVGEFDFVTGQDLPFPIRAVTTKGRSALARSALDDAAELTAKLGEYFALRYPYSKLDLVAVPDFAPGAMENPGLVTFRDSLILLDPERATISSRRAQTKVIAHELAHQWFGDLVTMKWWNDVWLNEGFATWAQAKIVDAWRPAFGATLEQLAAVQGVMDLDALTSARAVRQPVRSAGEATEAFDGLTYDKGAAVLRMLEGWLGADTFRHGIQHYLRSNAWKSVSVDDLYASLDFVSTQHVGPLASAFLDQSGVPELVSTRTCGSDGNRIELRESEWRPLGEPRRDVARSWTLPACISAAGDKAPSCFTLGAEPIVRSLGSRCPAWVYPNAEQAGYYRFLLEPAQLAALVAARPSLSVADRIGLVSNAWAGVRQGAIAPDALLDALASFDSETNRLVVEQIVAVLGGIERALVDDRDLPAFRRYVSARLASKTRALGWARRTADDDDRVLERQNVLWTEGLLANDPGTLREAEKYASAWIKNPKSVPGDIANVAVPLASLEAKAERLDELRSALKTAATPQDRIIAIRAMGMFDDPIVLRRALDLTLTDELRLSDLRYLFDAAQNRRSGRGVTYAWVKERWDKLRARLPSSALRSFASTAGTVCTAAQRDDARSFFAPALQGVDGAKRGLDEALEQADLCVALREYGQAAVTKYFARR